MFIQAESGETKISFENYFQFELKLLPKEFFLYFPTTTQQLVAKIFGHSLKVKVRVCKFEKKIAICLEIFFQQSYRKI